MFTRQKKVMLSFLIITLLVATILAGCAKPAPPATQAPSPTAPATTPAQQIQWKLYDMQAAGNIVVKLSKKFAENVSKRTGQQLLITVYAGGELPYKPADLLRVVRDRKVEMAEMPNTWLVGDAPIFQLSILPLIATDFQELQKVTGVTQPYEDKAFEEFNSRRLSRFSWSAQKVWTTKTPLTRPQDVKGLKMRVTSAGVGDLMKRLGAVPFTVATGEVYTALQMGVADGVVTAAVGLHSYSWSELVKYGLTMPVSWALDGIIVNQDAWQALPADLRKVVTEEAQALGEELQRSVVTEDDELMKKLQTEFGIKIAEVPQEDMDQLQQAMKPLWQEWAEGTGPDAVEALNKVLAVLGL